MTPILQLDDVRKHYSVRSGLSRRAVSVRAVDGVSLQLERGETLGLVGESGCGKSTLARTLVLLEKPDSGEIRFDGRPVAFTDRAALRRDAQIVFQDPYTSLPPHMKVRRIIAEPLLIHRMAAGAELRDRVEALIADVGLPASVADKLPGQLSGGQRQRVSIARALALEPSLLIADESVSALDVSVQAQILNLLNSLRERHGLTLLFVSHDIGVVTYVSQRIAVMYLGKIVELGPTADVYGRPLHPYTRALMAAVPSVERRGRERIEVRGDPPDPKHPPPGCAFHPRCPIAQDICRVEAPAVREWLPGRHAACHFALGPETDGRNNG
ncbi:ABC transporter ATP-binding protein [Phytoactinopolyspora halotolerans]|uniref:ATP-binding cassette domain-containing protein n=1 Tax=Phytoactinopolyspora halotolerans TaxID=1981512 RepID=A0A6L9SFM2_9ACTN|nr:oligopeptide/dipeptide ABC transporter ATP-binding protein [Phytoactinopolyspora halotolerans]NEE03262.1 ATP-binding cassette domain-containing protein [Phytoactinopolyspora halotolerans]